jgi:hypothetical protein
VYVVDYLLHSYVNTNSDQLNNISWDVTFCNPCTPLLWEPVRIPFLTIYLTIQRHIQKDNARPSPTVRTLNPTDIDYSFS